MQRPSDAVIESFAPAREIDELAVSDAGGVRNVAHAEQRDSMRIPRPDGSSLVIVQKAYDGSNGGEPGRYVLAYVEFHANSSRWRTAGVKIRQSEAARLARDLEKGKESKPGRAEPPRIGGKQASIDDSTLRGAEVDGGKGYVVYVRHRDRGNKWARTLGVEIQTPERAVVAAVLKQLAKAPPL